MRAPELPALALLLVGALPAGAALDEPVSSLQADRLQLMANRHQRETGAGYEVHSLQAADGSLVREYVSSDGIVFAVSWSTRGKPRLDRLLGRHHASYEVAARQAMRLRAGVQHAALLQQGDLVVESTAHLNAYSGRAWLRSRLPPGMAGVR